MGDINFHSDDFAKYSAGDEESSCITMLPEQKLGAQILTPSQTIAPPPPPPQSMVIGEGNVILGIIDTVGSLLNNLAYCCSAVAMEKQRTKQVRYQTDAIIESARQQTAQVTVTQQEQTARFVAQCEKEIRLKKIELKQVKETLNNDLQKSKLTHKETMVQLQILPKTVDALLDMRKEMVHHLWLEDSAVVNSDLMNSIDRIGTQLVEVATQIATMSKG